MENDGSPELSESDVVAILAHRRRLVVRTVEDCSPPLSACRPAELVGGREFDDPSSDALRNVRLSLVHQHLPRLDGDDVVAYDSESDAIGSGNNFGVVLGAIRALSDGTDTFVDQ